MLCVDRKVISHVTTLNQFLSLFFRHFNQKQTYINPIMALASRMALSVSSSDWSTPPQQQKYNTQWELWETNSNSHQVHCDNPMIISGVTTSSSDWSHYSSERKYNHRWEQWEIEDEDSHLTHPERDGSHHPFGNPRPGTPSSDWSPRSEERKYDHHWRQWATGGSNRDSNLSHLSVDEDYISPQNSRRRPGPSNIGPMSRENSTQPQNQNTQRIGMTRCNLYCITHFSLISIYNLAPHLLNPRNWVPAYTDVRTLKPGDIVSVTVLDFFLNLESHQSQLSTDFKKRFYYLSQDTINNLTGEFGHEQGPLQQTLTTIDEKTVSCPFLFLVTAPTTYFLVMFDFCKGNALILGHRGLSGPDFHKAYGEWESWKGRVLWLKIYTALIRPGFEELDTEPIVYETDLILVAKSIHLIYNLNLEAF